MISAISIVLLNIPMSHCLFSPAKSKGKSVEIPQVVRTEGIIYSENFYLQSDSASK
ncbi:hypothetical protein GTN66_04135 [bacterium]|nr:hypothetical protein [bacterium]NIO73591.1 hypothetical protein [bacterium]